MEANRHFGKLGLGGRGLSSRRNSAVIAAVSAVLAAALIYLFVTHYNKNTAPPVAAPIQATVWVATHAIPQGTPESAIAADGYFKPTHVPSTQVTGGAILDPSQVVGMVTSTAIDAGQQVTAADFVRSAAVLPEYLKGAQRAVAFSFDAEHGLSSWLATGDTVDIMLLKKSGQSELIGQNVSVLENAQGLVVLKLTDKQALLMTSFSNQGSFWLSLRPSIKATDSIKLYSIGS